MTNNTSGLNGWIYFIRANDAIKIGFSVQPKSRVASLQTSHHHTLEVLATVPTSLIGEREAHQRFEHLRIRGEWFRADKELFKFIDSLKKGKKPAKPTPRPKKPASAEMNSLMALRAKHGADSPIGHRCSNLIGQVRSMQDVEGDHREALADFMRQQAAQLKQLLAKAA